MTSPPPFVTMLDGLTASIGERGIAIPPVADIVRTRATPRRTFYNSSPARKSA